MAEEQQPGDYITCPKCPLSQKGKKTEPHNWQSPELGHTKCKTKSL